MTAQDRRKIINYFEGLECAEGNGRTMEIGTMVTNMEYGRGDGSQWAESGVVLVDFRLRGGKARKVRKATGGRR